MGKSAAVQIPGEEAATASAETGAPDPKDAEIAALKAQLAARDSGPAVSSTIVRPGTGPHIDEAWARSKHKHLTGAQLHQQIADGKADLGDQRMVLCSDGWYVNPKFVKREG